ncbi:MAG: tetratricopeptide repeat protein [Hoeflea sp.]|uniref:tetratricopeptide repeat protein n=1 Tax=Hoeflea sp. TaxID=1940281 RepID=UPI001D4B85B0|nr:tetratricopeptide repeat protein [Hoeflea sp.]MBU4530782.1 tetratricopeptide repeat protein [Alphaproteobacteria bacterium]MBU4544781.1 tetratricopeptide repeat protein [Alphaproteobacteria bacterium]MBU4549337.1 tetratricopeptide repeat protein [Alphaproteobacteria bacterium]MBV1726376.1 tetratricopeptide repeat protein [Hoeflea sp.]MBV1761718.1 tetratricopeptide repeat protein [Hoeflea sp.]
MQRRQFLIRTAALGILAGHPTALLADTASQRERLFATLKNARTERDGRIAENAIWEWWVSQAPTPGVRDAIDHGMKRRESHDFEAAETAFDIAVREAPSYAEGWNQRAFARFLRENIGGALSDLEKAVELEPKHFGAWSGMYHLLMRMGRPEAATAALTRAVEIHPWLKERGMLPPDPDAKRPLVEGKQQEL